MDMRISADGEVPLAHLGVIRARGADATRFLQSQLTNDIAAIGRDEARLAGFCSAKGRLQASFIVWKAADDDVLLACAQSVLAPTLKRLSMFVLRAQCKLSDASAEVPLLGCVGASARRRVGERRAWSKAEAAGAMLIRLPDVADTVRCIAAGTSAESTDELSGRAATMPGIEALTLDCWRWLEVRSGLPTIEAATVDRFVPQMLNFELIGGVDFQKGCYPGQEVVARSQYRGTIKRRMHLFDLDVPTAPGTEVFHSDDPGQPAGMVVNAAPSPLGGWSALVEIKLAALEGGSLHLERADGAALRPAGLPYAVA